MKTADVSPEFEGNRKQVALGLGEREKCCEFFSDR
jgi:hypothetical protein